MKKIISLVLVLVLALTAIGGTLAYFTDTDAADNVFTVGNIDIKLIEQQHNEDTEDPDDLEDFEQNKELMPGTTQDKIVTVKNIGKNDAYVRVTIVIPEGLTALWPETTGDWTRSPATGAGAGTYVYTCEKPLVAGDTTPVLLEGVMLNADVTALDVQATYTVPVDVEAIQIAGFEDADAAYAELTAINGETVEASNQVDLNNAVAEAEGKTTIALDAGTYALPALTNKEVVISGNKDTVIDLVNNKIPNTNGAEVMFDGVTVNFAESNYQGLTHTDKVVYRDCVIKGQQTLYAENVQFINCTFENQNSYNVWTYGAKNVTFTDCTFTTGGRAIMVYNEMTNASFVANVTLNNCTFTDDGTYVDPKAAVETGVADLVEGVAKNTATSNVYNITFNGCTNKITGFEANNSTSALWGNKNSMDNAHLNVFIDGAEVH